jgi:cytochrome c553
MKRKTPPTPIATRIAAFAAIISGLTLFSTFPVMAQGDAEAGKYAFAACSGCHAIPGYTNTYPTYRVPRLGGQHPEYIVDALKAYKEGNRGHETMHANAADLSDDDMANIAAFLAGFELSDQIGPIAGDAGQGKQKAESCEACHGASADAGLTPKPPRLQGQFHDYLVKALKDYQSGARNNAIMSGMAASLSEQDIADIAAYYASSTPALAVIDYSGHK